MPLTVIPFTIDIVIGGTIWMSELSTPLKTIITIILVVKFCIYFYSALVADSDLIRNIGLIVCALLNVAGTIYAAIQGLWTATISFATLLVLLAIGEVLTTADFFKEGW